MIISHSKAYVLIMNLSNVSHYHKGNCTSDGCGVSLILLKQTAHLMINEVFDEEQEEIELTIKNMPFS